MWSGESVGGLGMLALAPSFWRCGDLEGSKIIRLRGGSAS